MRGQGRRGVVEIDLLNSKSRLKGKRELHVLRRNDRMDCGSYQPCCRA